MSVLFLLAQLNGVFLLTSMRRSRRARPFVLVLIFLWFLLELGTHWAVQSSVLGVTVRDALLVAIRKFSFWSASLTLFLGMCWWPPSTEDVSVSEPVKLKEMQAAHEDLSQQVQRALAARRVEMLQRDERIVRVVQESLQMRPSIQYFPVHPHPRRTSSLENYKRESNIERNPCRAGNRNISINDEYSTLKSLERQESVTTQGSFASSQSRNDKDTLMEEEIERVESNP